jgi:hypothetical protein
MFYTWSKYKGQNIILKNPKNLLSYLACNQNLANFFFHVDHHDFGYITKLTKKNTWPDSSLKILEIGLLWGWWTQECASGVLLPWQVPSWEFHLEFLGLVLQKQWQLQQRTYYNGHIKTWTSYIQTQEMNAIKISTSCVQTQETNSSGELGIWLAHVVGMWIL